MDARFIEKTLKLAKKTGDTVILAPEDGTDGVVIVPFEAYERLIGSPDESLTDGPRKVIINREVQQKEHALPNTETHTNWVQGDEREGESVIEEDRYYMEPLD